MKYIAFSLEGTPVPVPKSIVPIMNNTNLFGQNFFQTGINILLIATILLAFFFILWSSIQWIMSEGDKTKLQAARARLTYSIIGLIIALLAIFIVNVVSGFFGVSFFPTP